MFNLCSDHLIYFTVAPVFKSKVMLCKKPNGLPPTSWDFKQLLCSVCIFISLIYSVLNYCSTTVLNTLTFK